MQTRPIRLSPKGAVRPTLPLLLLALVTLGEAGCSGKTETTPEPPPPQGNWSAFGNGVDGTVDALFVYQDALIAGGTFTTAGGVEAHGIASFNGSAWKALGSGVSGDVAGPVAGVAVLAEYNGKLIVGGKFSHAGEAEASCVAQWDGSAWTALGSGLQGSWLAGLDPSVEALAVFEGDLYAGGNFIQAGDVDASCIARWNGTEWSAVGPPLNAVGGFLNVGCLEVYGGALIAGGLFGLIDLEGEATYHVARWNGSEWQPLGGGISRTNYVSSFTLFNGDLIAAGRFQQAGGREAKSIARWDGTAWRTLDGGLSAGTFGEGSDVYVLLPFNETLVAGGLFGAAGDTTALRVARWDGTRWRAMGVGMGAPTSPVYVGALAVYRENLIAGGGFAVAGGTAARGLARWIDQPASP